MPGVDPAVAAEHALVEKVGERGAEGSDMAAFRVGADNERRIHPAWEAAVAGENPWCQFEQPGRRAFFRLGGERAAPWEGVDLVVSLLQPGFPASEGADGRAAYAAFGCGSFGPGVGAGLLSSGKRLVMWRASIPL